MARVARTAGAVARLLMVLLALGTSVPVAAHGESGHDPCESGDVSSTAPSSVDEPAAPTAPQHCGVCHWLRSLRAFDVALAAPATGTDGGWTLSALGLSPLSHLHVPAAPGRGPPA